MRSSVKANTWLYSAIARRSAVCMAIGPLLCVVGCSRTSQSDVSQAGTQQALEAVVRNFAEQHRLPGLAAGVWRHGEPIFRIGIGHQDGPGSPTIDGQTVFHLASVTKPFVATAVMQLVEEGKMCLDCLLRRYLPYFSMEGSGADQITIRQILTHTAGMGDTNDFAWTTPEYDDGAVERYVRSLATVRLDFTPGSEWRYSNRGFDVLADAIAKADGQPFEAVIQRRVLTPLGMRQSTLLMSDIDSARLALGHRRDGTPVGYYPYNRRHAGSSTLHSTLDDMLRWAAANLGRGAVDQRRILPASAYDEPDQRERCRPASAQPRPARGSQAIQVSQWVFGRNGFSAFGTAGLAATYTPMKLTGACGARSRQVAQLEPGIVMPPRIPAV